jgi:hypothetical protein
VPDHVAPAVGWRHTRRGQLVQRAATEAQGLGAGGQLPEAAGDRPCAADPAGGRDLHRAQLEAVGLAIRGLRNVRAISDQGFMKASSIPGGMVVGCSSNCVPWKALMRATRSSGRSGGSPMWKSKPSGTATSSRKKHPRVRRAGSVRRISSAAIHPEVT